MNLRITFAAVALLGLAACSSDEPAAPVARSAVSPVTTPTPAPHYLALPGQAAVAVSADVDAAFDQQAAAYANAPAAPAAAVSIPTPADTTASAAPETTPTAPATPAAAAPDVTATTPAAQTPAADATTAPSTDATADVTSHSGNMNYKVRITNGTEGRLFIEAQDAAGTIYPCGFMEEGRTFTTPMEQAAPIKAPITIVVRDPDQPGAPEIRRYKVHPPLADYNGKAIGITVLSGGRYTAALDGQTYYASPAAAPAPAATDNSPKPESVPAGE